MMATELEKCSQFSSVHCDVGAHLLSRIQFSVTPWAATARLLCPWDFPSKHTGVGCHFLLQGWVTSTNYSITLTLSILISETDSMLLTLGG